MVKRKARHKIDKVIEMLQNPVEVQKSNGQFFVVDSRDNYIYGVYSEEMANRVVVQANKRIYSERANSINGKAQLD